MSYVLYLFQTVKGFRSESIVTEVKNPGLKNVHITLDEFLTS